MEDAAQQLETKVGGQRPSEVLIPRLLLLFKSDQQDAKCLAVAILNLLALKMPAALIDSLDMCVSHPRTRLVILIFLNSITVEARCI